MLNYQDFQDLIGELEEFYGGKVLNGRILESTWYATLKKLTAEQLQSGIARCFKKHPRQYNFFPSPEQVLEFSKGEYRPPGENIMGDFSLAALSSHEDRATPEQIAEANKRGRLITRIVLNCRGVMTTEEKEDLIQRLRNKTTHELEDISLAAERAQKLRKPELKSIASILQSLKIS